MGKRLVMVGMVVAVLGTTTVGIALAQGNRTPAAGQRNPVNENVSRMPGNQDEQSIAVNPTNPLNIVAMSNLDAGSANLFAGLMESYTFDGGRTWTSRVIATRFDGMKLACCDNTVAFDSYGNLFLSYLLDRPQPGTVPIYLSTDGGLTFKLIHTVKPTPGQSAAGPVGPSKLLGATDASADQQTVTTGAGSVWVTYSSFSPTSLVVQSAGA